MGDHLAFTAEVVGKQHREEIDLITDPGAGGDIIELIVGFELGEDPVIGELLILLQFIPHLLSWKAGY
jgi:hypothetical protein